MIYFYRKYSDLSSVAEEKPDKPDKTVIRNVRAYQPGDNARALNFRLMARGQGAMVNVYEKIAPRRACFLLDGASFSQLPPEALESALEILASLMAQLAGEEVAVSLLISRAAGWPEQFAACRNRRELSAPLLLLAAADPSAALTEEEILARLPGLSSTFLVCGDVRRLEAGTCTLLARHHVPLLAWGQQAHPLLTVLDLRDFQEGGRL